MFTDHLTFPRATNMSDLDIATLLEPLELKAEICVVVPAYNEAPVIESSLKALLNIVHPEDIYVVSDGSKDNTAALAANLVPNVLDLQENVGKAKALDLLIKNYQLTTSYNYILFADADSRFSPNFIWEVRKAAAKKPACIIGTVTSDPHGLISAYRTYEYALTHRVFKQAQHTMKVITVAPGCATLYRSDILQHLDFSRHTLTEDFDLTLQVHAQKVGDLVYIPQAKVITQDPPTFKDYWKQITRWYTGFWQNFFLHKIYIPNKKVNLELWLILADGFSWTLTLALALLTPLLFLKLFLLSEVLVFCLALTLLALEKQSWAMKYIPFFPIFMFVNATSYMYSLFRAIRSTNKKLSWQKVDRYAVA